MQQTPPPKWHTNVLSPEEIWKIIASSKDAWVADGWGQSGDESAGASQLPSDDAAATSP